MKIIGIATMSLTIKPLYTKILVHMTASTSFTTNAAKVSEVNRMLRNVSRDSYIPINS